MNRLEYSLSNPGSSGVYRLPDEIPSTEVQAIARRLGLRFLHLDCSGATTKSAFFARAADALRFPGYFGRNWDAFEECVADMGVDDAPGFAILIEGLEDFGRESPKDLKTALDILAEAARDRAGRRVAFFVLARLPGDAFGSRARAL